MRDAKLDAIALVEARRRGDTQARGSIADSYEGTDLTELVGNLRSIDGVEDLSLSTNAPRLAIHAYDLKRA